MTNINGNYNNKPVKQTSDDKKTMTKDEVVKIVYEESIFGKAEKAYNKVTKEIPEKLLKESESWGWVQKVRNFLGIKPENKTENKK